MRINQKHKLLSGLLLGIFLSYQIGIVLFTHTHFIHGIAIVHAHPSDKANHTHTEEQAYAIAFVSTFHGNIVNKAYDTQPIFYPIEKIGSEISLSPILAYYKQGINLRAPPFCC